jgi:hypothetical protein
MASRCKLPTFRTVMNALLVVLLNTSKVLAQSPTLTISPSDSKSPGLVGILCGVPPTPVMNAIPGIGCCEVDAGKRATGTVAGGQLTVTVSERGEPSCSLGTDAIQCNGCVTRSDPACPTQHLIVTHNPDGSVLFSVQRNADGNRYIYSQQIWYT